LGGGAEFARNWICKERGWKLQGKEYSRKGPTIRIRVNMQGMDLSRKSISGIRKERNMQPMDFARNRATRRHLPCVGSHCFTCYPTQVNGLGPSPQAGTPFTYPGGMECWVGLGYTAMERPGVELATSWSQVQRPNHYTTEPPTDIDVAINLSWSTPQTWRADVTPAGFGRKIKKFGAILDSWRLLLQCPLAIRSCF